MRGRCLCVTFQHYWLLWPVPLFFNRAKAAKAAVKVCHKKKIRINHKIAAAAVKL